jgi:Sec23-binding domain of Sec16
MFERSLRVHSIQICPRRSSAPATLQVMARLGSYRLRLLRHRRKVNLSSMTFLTCRYCESIAATLQKEKRGSIFITPTLIAALRELTERLADNPQTSFTDKSSWFGSKATRGDNFWKAFESKVTQFVAGDDATEEIETNGHRPKPIEVQDQRFGRIASDTNLNKMVSMPNLRGQATTPIYGQFPPDNRRASGAHSRYSTAASDRYGPGGPVAATQDYDAVRPGSMPTSGIPTPDIPAAGYSPYMQQTATMASNYAPSSSYAPPFAYSPPSSYAPPAPATPTPVEIPEIIHEEPEEKRPATPVEEDEDKSDSAKDKKGICSFSLPLYSL